MMKLHPKMELYQIEVPKIAILSVVKYFKISAPDCGRDSLYF